MRQEGGLSGFSGFSDTENRFRERYGHLTPWRLVKSAQSFARRVNGLFCQSLDLLRLDDSLVGF